MPRVLILLSPLHAWLLSMPLSWWRGACPPYPSCLPPARWPPSRGHVSTRVQVCSAPLWGAQPSRCPRPTPPSQQYLPEWWGLPGIARALWGPHQREAQVTFSQMTSIPRGKSADASRTLSNFDLKGKVPFSILLLSQNYRHFLWLHGM